MRFVDPATVRTWRRIRGFRRPMAIALPTRRMLRGAAAPGNMKAFLLPFVTAGITHAVCAALRWYEPLHWDAPARRTHEMQRIGWSHGEAHRRCGEITPRDRRREQSPARLRVTPASTVTFRIQNARRLRFRPRARGPPERHSRMLSVELGRRLESFRVDSRPCRAVFPLICRRSTGCLNWNLTRSARTLFSGILNRAYAPKHRTVFVGNAGSHLPDARQNEEPDGRCARSSGWLQGRTQACRKPLRRTPEGHRAARGARALDESSKPADNERLAARGRRLRVTVRERGSSSRSRRCLPAAANGPPLDVPERSAENEGARSTGRRVLQMRRQRSSAPHFRLRVHGFESVNGSHTDPPHVPLWMWFFYRSRGFPLGSSSSRSSIRESRTRV